MKITCLTGIVNYIYFFFLFTYQSNYNKEVNDYKEHLEKIYNLCYKCTLYVHQELERQDLALKLRHSQYLSSDSLFSSQTSSSTSESSLPEVSCK